MPAWWNMSASAEWLHVPVSSWGVWCTLREWHDQRVPVFTLQEWRLLSWQNRSVVAVGLRLLVVVNLYVWDSCLPGSFNFIFFKFSSEHVSQAGDQTCWVIVWWTGNVWDYFKNCWNLHTCMHAYIHKRACTCTCARAHTHTQHTTAQT